VALKNVSKTDGARRPISRSFAPATFRRHKEIVVLFYGAACGSPDELQSIHQVMRKIWTDFCAIYTKSFLTSMSGGVMFCRRLSR